MQASAPPVGQHNEQQPALPSYAEAMRTAGPPNFSQTCPYPVDQGTFPTPTYGPQPVPVVQQQYYNQPNYAQAPLPTYTTNAYPQYGQTAADLEGPTTIHIIRPVVSTRNSCCRGARGYLLGIVLGLVIMGAILRVTVNSHF